MISGLSVAAGVAKKTSILSALEPVNPPGTSTIGSTETVRPPSGCPVWPGLTGPKLSHVDHRYRPPVVGGPVEPLVGTDPRSGGEGGRTGGDSEEGGGAEQCSSSRAEQTSRQK